MRERKKNCSTRVPTLRKGQIDVLNSLRGGEGDGGRAGEVEVTDDFAGESRGTMSVFRPGRFVGDLNILTGQAVSL